MNKAKGHSIVFYNVENLYDTIDDPEVADTEFTPHGDKHWTSDRLQKKLDDIGEVLINIATKHPLIVGLTEVENREVVEQLLGTDVLKEINYQLIHQDSPDNRGIDLCLFYDEDLVEYISHQYLRIHFSWNPDIKTRDVLFFECKINNEHFWIVVNHWPSRRNGSEETENKRVHVAKEVRKRLNYIMKNYSASKILVMGDFNDEPSDLSIVRHLKAKANKNIDEFELFNLSFADFEKDQGSSSHDGDWMMIDQMMINRNFLQNKNEGVGVANNKSYLFKDEMVIFRNKHFTKPNQTYAGDKYVGGVSDHLPVYIKLS
ncbi:MAG: hypothetical protein H6600_09720 [Flavobacteriales bacterium]|nr:hypothetical protein [Flavobacteriales bacterium]MCB9198728.1 hypothetical protein [Flavobacteriales bacterium]